MHRNIKALLLSFISFFSLTQVMGMDIEPPSSLLEKLPLELQTYLLPFLTSANTLGDAVKNIQSLARVNKQFHALVNESSNMRNIIQLLIQKFNKYDDQITEVEIIRKLETIRMPGVQNNPPLMQWFRQRKKRKFKKEADKQHEFIDAAAAGNLGEVSKFLKEGIKINWRGGYGANSALATAAGRGQKAMVEFLLKNGADPEVKTKYGETALLYAIDGIRHGRDQQTQLDIIALLLAAGANPNANKDGWSALISAVGESDTYQTPIALVQMLVSAGADVSYIDHGKNGIDYSALYFACRNKREDIIKLLEAAKK